MGRYIFLALSCAFFAMALAGCGSGDEEVAPRIESVTVEPPSGSGSFGVTVAFRPGTKEGSLLCDYPSEEEPGIASYSFPIGIGDPGKVNTAGFEISVTKAGIYQVNCTIDSSSMSGQFEVTEDS